MKKPVLLLSFLFSLIVAHAQTYTINTFAGTGVSGYNGDGILATAAQLSNPLEAITDKYGNVYIADDLNSRIRKVDTNGIITTVTGDGNFAYTGDGGPATAAEIDEPIGLALDRAGNLYFADFWNVVIRKIDTNGIITTVAGTGAVGFSGDGGQATDAQISHSRAIAIDDSDNLLIADELNNRIRKVNTQGIISTIIGTGAQGYTGDGGQASNAEINIPGSVMVDNLGNIYIGDANKVVRKITTNGIINTIAGNGTAGYSGDGGQATDAEMYGPDGLAIDNNTGYIFIADIDNQRIRQVDNNGIITTIAGNGNIGHTGDGGSATAADLNYPAGVSTDTMGNIYISEVKSGGDDVRKLTNPCHFSTSITSSSANVCGGQPVLLTASAAVGSAFQWVGTANTTDTLTVYPMHDTIYEVQATNNDCFAVKYISVTVKATAPLTVQPPSQELCSGQSVTLSVDGKGTGFTWSPSTGLNATTGDSVLATPINTTTYTVSGTDSVGCPWSATTTITVNLPPNKPTITVSVTGDSLISSAGSYNQWFFNNTILTDSIRQVLVVKELQKGDYSVTVTNQANGCSTSSDSIAYTGINQLSASSNQLTIYPNPTTGLINITSTKNIEGITVTNLLGQTILKSFSKNYDLKQTIDLSKFADGMYFVTVASGDGTTTAKIVVSR